jgi:twinkle protein
MSFYNVKTKISSDGKPISQSFVYPNRSSKTRYLDRKDFYWDNSVASEPSLFGKDKFSAGSHKYVTITEGEYDALSLYQVLKSPVVSIRSAASAASDCAMERSWLNSFERIYIAFDSDAAGKDATARVARLFDYNKVFQVKFTKHKDANEYAQAGESDELRNIWWNSKQYLPDAIISSFSDFKTILTETTKSAVPYPFPTLTEMTYGIRTGESVLVTALEGVGKTEFMHAIEYELLKGTDEPVGAIFLEEPKKRHLQAMAGLHLKVPAHLPTCGLSELEIFEAVKQAAGKDDRLHIYNHFGSDSPDTILDNIRFLVGVRGCRYILLDHIGMVVSGLLGDDERRALDYLATRLEMMVVELDFALLLVSHVNDNGETRGSRMIGKICNTRIDLTRDVKAGECVTHLLISKNRFGQRTGRAGDLLFNPLTYTLSEIPEATNDNAPQSLSTNIFLSNAQPYVVAA